MLAGLLQERGTDTVVVCGLVTNVCVEATTTDAVHNATLHTVYRSFGDVRTSDEVLALVAAGR